MNPITAPGRVWILWHNLTHPNDYPIAEANLAMLGIYLGLFDHMEYEDFVNDVLSDCDRVYGGTVN